MISLEPSRFRSPLLAALPATADNPDRRSLRLRRGLVALAVVGLVVPAILVKTRWLSPQGPGYFLYWLHDSIYLPLKGWLFTWLFPASWIYLLASTSLIVFALVALAWKGPLMPAWQALVGRKLLGFRRVRQLMRSWDRRFKVTRARLLDWAGRAEAWPRVGPFLARRLPPPWLAGPTLLDEVIEHEHEAILGRLDALAPTAEAALEVLNQATELTAFSAGVTAPLTGHRFVVDQNMLLAITRLNQTLLRLELIRVMSDEAEDTLKALREQLESEIIPRLQRFLPKWGKGPNFALPALASDLALLLGDGSRQQVLQAALTRGHMLDASRRKIERWVSYGQRRQRGFSLSDLEVPQSPTEARLAVDLALLATLRFKAPRGALTFLESLEGLRFAFLMVGEMDAACLSAIEHLPQAFDYRVCAGLSSLPQATDPDLAEAIGRRSEVVSRSDLELISARRAELWTAAADPGA